MMLMMLMLEQMQTQRAFEEAGVDRTFQKSIDRPNSRAISIRKIGGTFSNSIPSRTRRQLWLSRFYRS